MYHFFICSSADGHSCCFHILAIANSTAVNTGVHVSFLNYSFLWISGIRFFFKVSQGRSPADGIGYPLQYSWASLMAQLVKNLLEMRETWVWSPGWEDPLGEGKVYPLQYSGLENSIDCIDHGVAKSQTWLSGFHVKVILMYGWDGEPLWLTYSPLPDPIAKLSTLQCYLDLYPRISSFLPFLEIQMNI